MRRFSEQELKLHRDSVYQAIRSGLLVADEELAVRMSTIQPIATRGLPSMIPEAVNLLIELAQGDGEMFTPNAMATFGSVHSREAAKHYAAFEQLQKFGYLRHGGGDVFVLTLEGYDAADVYLAMMNEKPD